MKITDLRVDRYSESGPVIEVYAGREVLVVTVATDSGASGTAFITANVSPYGISGDVAATLIRRNFRNMLLGEDPLLTEKLWQKMYAGIWRIGRRGLVLQCLGAIDTALWDLKAQLLNVPLWNLLGNDRARVPTYITAGQQLPPDKLAERAADLVKAGHRSIKVRGSATAVSLAEATARVREVRAAIGPEPKLLVDVNGTWDVDTAIEQLKRWEPYDVYWLEEPVPPEDIPGYVRVRQRAGRTLIAGGEQHATLFEFRQLIEQGAVDVVQPNVNVTGGLTEWLRIHALARAFNVPVSPWNLQLIHLHMAVGLPHVKWIEYFAPSPTDLLNRLFQQPVIKTEVGDDGVYLLPPTGPGLGLVINPQTAEETRIKDED